MSLSNTPVLGSNEVVPNLVLSSCIYNKAF